MGVITAAQLEAARDIIRRDPSLIWYTKSYDTLDIRSVVEAVLNFGSRAQFHNLLQTIGLNNAADVFRQLDSMPRNNLHPIYRNYYSHYFARHAH